jgi:carboxyl-terminal processing protease
MKGTPPLPTRTTTHPFFRRTAVMLLALFSLTFHFRSTAAEKLKPEHVAILLPQILDIHVKQHTMDPAFMKRLMKEFVDQLDAGKSFYTKSEAEAIINLTDDDYNQLAQRAMDGDLGRFKDIMKDFLDKQIARDADMYAGLEKRGDEIKTKAKDRAKARTDKPDTKPDTVVKPTKPDETIKKGDDDEYVDPDGIVWKDRPASNEEREKRLVISTASLYSFNKDYLKDDEAFKLAIQAIQRTRDKWVKTNVDDDVAKLFLKSFMMALDPHSDYLEGDDEEDFTSHMERSFAGIGVQIRPCPLGAHIEDVIKGGPSDKSGKFARGDQIVAVDNVVLAGMTINKIVKLIKGEKGTEVKLTVLKRETNKTDVITLKRDTIELADMRVKGKIQETPEGPVGLISVQAFYQGVHNDVRDRLNEISKGKPLAGVVLDLRNNTGGYLEEAIGLASLFIESGAVVGERSGRNKIQWQDDPDEKIEFRGPLVILTNQFSASASEIVTGTLKAYGRAVVVSHTQTFGKGTVQKVLPLNSHGLPGEIKVTTDQYFLANGSSVQLKGVDPDVIIPGPKLLNEDGYLEAATPNAIAWNQIPGRLEPNKPEVKMWSDWKNKNLKALQFRSNLRVEANPDFANMFDPKKRKDKALEKLDKPDGPSLDDKDKKDEKDPQAEEAVAITRDMISTWPLTDGQAVATMKLEPDYPIVKIPESTPATTAAGTASVKELNEQIEKLKAENTQLREENEKLRKGVTQSNPVKVEITK